MDWVIVGAIAAAGLALAYAVLDRLSRPPRRAVLPAHYDPRNYATDPSTIPGWCPRCETRNDPDYRYCGNCGAELPEVGTEDRIRAFGRE